MYGYFSLLHDSVDALQEDLPQIVPRAKNLTTTMMIITEYKNKNQVEDATCNVAELVKKVRPSAAASAGVRVLARDFRPGPKDVICARGKRALGHEGNIRFRRLIGQNLRIYSESTTKLEKSLIVTSIVDNVRQSSPHGGFIKKDKGQWYEVGDHIAREKCGQRSVHPVWRDGVLLLRDACTYLPSFLLRVTQLSGSTPYKV
jgi:hypothetical protein